MTSKIEKFSSSVRSHNKTYEKDFETVVLEHFHYVLSSYSQMRDSYAEMIKFNKAITCELLDTQNQILRMNETVNLLQDEIFCNKKTP